AGPWEDYGLRSKGRAEDAQAAMLAQGWPGNVRELANVVERAVLLSEAGRLTAAELALPRTAAPTAEASGAATATREEERRQLLHGLGGGAGDFSRAPPPRRGARATRR